MAKKKITDKKSLQKQNVEGTNFVLLTKTLQMSARQRSLDE